MTTSLRTLLRKALKMKSEQEQVPLVHSQEAFRRLQTEFSALASIMLLTAYLESQTSDGLRYRRLSMFRRRQTKAWEVYATLLPDQRSFVAKPENLIVRCASLTDLYFFNQYPSYIPLQWYGKCVYAWKSCFFVGEIRRAAVPYLDCRNFSGLLDERVTIRYFYLRDYFEEGHFAAMRTEC
jgi:hypothetical protein